MGDVSSRKITNPSASVPLAEQRCSKCLRGSVSTTDATINLSALRYQPLREQLATRVFELFPGNSHRPICGKLHQISLQAGDAPYVCLSYTWGDTNQPHVIECDGCRTNITCNLYSALLRIRDENSSTRIFIDALSINQSTDPNGLQERENQVKLMNQIFGNAQRVIVDLGDEKDDSNAVVDLLCKLSGIQNDTWNATLRNGSMHSPDIDVPELGARIWEHFALFSFRKWFERIWVVQEFALARELIIMVGNRRISEEVLIRGATRAQMACEILLLRSHWTVLSQPDVNRRVKRIHRSLSAAIQRLASFSRFRDSVLDHQKPSLVDALDHTRNFQATNKRDRVYALMGMVDSSEIVAFRVDYRESVDELSSRLTTTLFQNDQALLVLYRLAALESSSLSSWMIDLENPREYDLLEDQISKDGLCSKFQAGGSRHKFKCVNSNGGILNVSGWTDEVISEVSEIYPVKSLSTSSLTEIDEVGGAQIEEWFQKTSSMFRRHAVNLSPTKVQEVFYYTIAAGGALLNGLGEDLKFESLNQRIQAFQLLLRGNPRGLQLGQKYATDVAAICRGRRLGVTQNAKLSLVPAGTHVGDRIGIFQGAPIPFILREAARGYRLIGTAYVHGLMHGETVGQGDRKPDNIELE